MKHQKNVIGWTLFELVILLVFFVYPSYLARQELSKKEVQNLQNTLSRAALKIQTLEEEKGELKTKLVNMSEKEQLKSKQLPSCIEKGLASDFLFQVKIIGQNKYQIDKKEFTYQEILKFYESDIEFAKKNGCVHSIWVESDVDMNASAYIAALKLIQRSFYTALR
jgi:hypothetical protein